MANWATVARIKILLLALVILAGLAAVLWLVGRRATPEVATVNQNRSEIAPSTPAVSISATPSPAALTPPTETSTPSEPGASPSPGNQQTANELTDAIGFVGKLKLVVPVVGVRSDQLLDTFTDARSEGRSHDAIDIPAPAGTPVVAAADGEIVKLFESERGGTTIYQLSPDKKLIFYYAHLQGYAEGLVAGKFVKQGEVIAYVGDTGNAGAGNYHLHFSISIVPDPKRYWEGTNINPYPLLHK